ncbi:MAG: DUF2125 domain-containing protein [Alphaproteobacteria bacterium]
MRRAWKVSTSNGGRQKLTATGRFTVDDQRRPDGDLSLKLEHPGETFSALAKSPTASAQAGAVFSALSALGMAPVLTFRNGKKSLYGQKIGDG